MKSIKRQKDEKLSVKSRIGFSIRQGLLAPQSIIFVLMFGSTGIFGLTPFDHAVLNQMWYQKNIDILMSPALVKYADNAFANEDPSVKYLNSHLRHMILDYSYVGTKSVNFHNGELGFEWAFTENFSMIAAGKTTIAADDMNRSAYLYGGLAYYYEQVFTLKVMGGAMDARSPLQPNLVNNTDYTSFQVKNASMTIGLFDRLDLRAQYEYYGISLNDQLIASSTSNNLTFKKEDSSGLNYASITASLLNKFVPIPLTTSVAYYKLSDLKQLKIQSTLSTVIGNTINGYDLLSDVTFTGRDYSLFGNFDATISIFIPADFFAIHERSKQPLVDNESIHARYGFFLMGSYRTMNNDLPGNLITGFGGSIAYGAIWYTFDSSGNVRKVISMPVLRLFYHYSPESYSAPNYEWGVRLESRI